MEPVLQCLGTLKTHFEFTGGKESIREHLRRRWNLPKVEFSEGITNSLVYTATCDENPAINGDERQKDSFENKYGSSLDDSISSGLYETEAILVWVGIATFQLHALLDSLDKFMFASE